MKTNKIMQSKVALPALFLFLSINLSAQSGLSNMSFENWSTTFFGNAPVGWYGQNLSQQTTGAQQGSSYLRISNTSIAAGIIALGTPTSGGGVPFNQIPISIDGFYKTSGLAPGDVMYISAYTTKSGWNLSASGTFTITGNIASWTSFSCPVFSSPGGPADSIFVVASSDGLSQHNSLNAVLDLDNLSIISMPNSIYKNSLSTALIVFPNPTRDELNIISKDNRAASIVITGSDSRMIGELPLNQGSTKLDLKYYDKGIYFYSILDSEKRTLLKNKFIISE